MREMAGMGLKLQARLWRWLRPAVFILWKS